MSCVLVCLLLCFRNGHLICVVFFVFFCFFMTQGSGRAAGREKGSTFR